MIPRRFFWLFDLIVLNVGFVASYWLTPYVARVFKPNSVVYAESVTSSSPAPPLVLELPPFFDFLWVLVVEVLVAFVTFEVLGGYTPLLSQSRARILLTSFLAPTAGLSVVALILFAFKNPEWSRLFSFSFVFLGIIGLGSYRLLLRRYFQFRRGAGFYAKNVLLIGLPASIRRMAQYFAQNVREKDYHLFGYLSIQSDQTDILPLAGKARQSKEITPAVALIGKVEMLGRMLIQQPIHEVIAVQPSSGNGWVTEVIQTCDYLGILLRIVPETLLFGEYRTLRMLYPREPLHLPAVVLAPPHYDSDALFFKRLFDIVISATLLILLAPLFAAVALAIKITTPELPVFYPWHVVGQQGRPFTGYKFTTMDANADERKSELMSRNEMDGPVFKIKNDPRVTPLGRFLRKFDINELPQLWSVLKGDMSLVGPRPAGPHELERYEFWQKRKLCIRPGITCLWQVRGRNEICNFDDWVRMDLEYIDNWSLWLDFKILFWTFWVVIRGTGS